MPEAAVADLSPAADFDIRSEISSTLNAPEPEPAAAAAPAPAPEPEPTPAVAPAVEPPKEAEPEKAPEPETPTEAEAAPETPAAEPPAPAAAAEELPEGIIARDLPGGKKEYVLAPESSGQIMNAVRAVIEAENLLGMPLSAETIGALYESHMMAARLENDLTIGGQPGVQNVLSYLNSVSRAAITAGSTQQDGMAAIALAMPGFLAQNNPNAFNAQYRSYLRLGLDGLYKAAANSGNQNLHNAAAVIDNQLFGKYNKEIGKKADPVDERLQQALAAESRVRQAQQQDQQQQWQADLNANNEKVNDSVDRVIKEYTAPLEPPYKQFPKHLQSIRKQLRDLLNDSISGDANWRQQRDVLLERAATSPATKRKESLAQVIDLYRSKAQITLNPSRNPRVREIINEESALVKSRTDSALKRAETAAERKSPGSGGATPNRSVLPAPNKVEGFASRDEIAAEIAQALG